MIENDLIYELTEIDTCTCSSLSWRIQFHPKITHELDSSGLARHPLLVKTLLLTNLGVRTRVTAKRIQSHPIGMLIKPEKKSGWHGSLTLSLDRGEKKTDQTNRIQVHHSSTALQPDSAASCSETCARDRRGFHGAILQCVESRREYALCAIDSCHRFERRL